MDPQCAGQKFGKSSARTEFRTQAFRRELCENFGEKNFAKSGKNEITESFHAQMRLLALAANLGIANN